MNDFSYLYLLFQALISFTIIYLWSSKLNLFVSKKYNAIQKIHIGSVPRLGGAIVYSVLLFYFYFNRAKYEINNEFFIFMLFLIPLIIISLSEDLFQNIAPKFRFFVISFTSLFFLYFSNISLPIVDIPILNSILQNNLLNIIFLSICISILANGMNMIDGTNGLLVLVCISQLISISLLASNIEAWEILKISLPMISTLVILLLFNFPFGKIFSGDLGAYFFGFFIGYLTVYFFGKYNNLLSWNAALILFYPVFEVLFTYIRRIKNNLSPFQADFLHLHSLIFGKLNKKLRLKRNDANYLATLILIPFIFLPTLLILNVFEILYLIIIAIIVMTILYLLYYKKFIN